ncbi:sugar phosphate isomerase/epimerase [bacterium]|nr:sugar phosphate isomerase/epimerase [bacterium]
MELSITTDYARDTGDPSPYLRDIAEAGFTHVHWCHHWNTDFLYSKYEIEHIMKWLNEYGLRLLDLHGAVGPEKNWYSPCEYERLAGVELVKNRMEMVARLSSDVVVMHLPRGPISDSIRESLDALLPVSRELGVRIALENGCFEAIRSAFAEYDPQFVGLCYDCGHGNMDQNGLDKMEAVKDRLIAVHLHDNDGKSDQHKLLFTGSVDWSRLATIIAESSYSKCASMEVSIGNMGMDDEKVFLQAAFDGGTTLSRMIDMKR